MKKQLLTLRDGKKIYAQIYDGSHKDFLIMLHGGPGQGAYDFQYQASKISEFINVIIFDQRGVLRSDRIGENEPFGLEYLIDDCEDIRNILGINSWSILGHSFGGMLALLYASKYPKAVKNIIFESPSFNFPMSMHSIYIKAAKIAVDRGNPAYADELIKFVNTNNELKLIIENFENIPKEIRAEVYNNADILEEVKLMNNLKDVTREQLENGQIHFERLLSEGKINENFLPLLSKLNCPSILMLGENDPVCCKEQQECYLKNSMEGRIIKFTRSGHTPHNDEPIKYKETVINFLS